MPYSDSTTLKLNYNDDTLLGKLSNLLDNKEKTLKLIILSIELIDKPFIAFKNGNVLYRSILVFKRKTNWAQLRKITMKNSRIGIKQTKKAIEIWSAPCQVDRKIIKVYDEFIRTRLFIYAGIFNPIDKVILFLL